MRIDHIALWVKDLEKTKDFYCKYFNMSANEKYYNPKKKFSSYFLTLGESETRIEIMHRPEVESLISNHEFLVGFTHIAITLGSKQKVDELTERFRADGYTIAGEPRTSGDGYYEAVIEDCEGNLVEIIK